MLRRYLLWLLLPALLLAGCGADAAQRNIDGALQALFNAPAADYDQEFAQKWQAIVDSPGEAQEKNQLLRELNEQYAQKLGGAYFSQDGLDSPGLGQLHHLCWHSGCAIEVQSLNSAELELGPSSHSFEAELLISGPEGQERSFTALGRVETAEDGLVDKILIDNEPDLLAVLVELAPSAFTVQ